MFLSEGAHRIGAQYPGRSGGLKTKDSKMTILEIKNFFGYTKLADFKADWEKLTDADKAQIKAGLSDGTFSY